MDSNDSDSLPVVVVGGGISGLAAAHRLFELDPRRPIRLLEASARLGGVLHTKIQQGFLSEAAADGFHGAANHVRDLCRRVGLADDIIDALPCAETAQVVHKGNLVPTPLAILSGSPPSARRLLTTSLLSWRGKCRVAAERWVSPCHADDESCASFFIRRFGAEFYARLVEPVLGGIYSTDPATLSMRALLPRLYDMEKRCGSLTAAFKQQHRQLPAGDKPVHNDKNGDWTLRRGMSGLTSAMAAKLPPGTINLMSPVHRLQWSRDRQWRVEYGRGRAIEAAAVVLAAPAHRVAHLLESISPQVTRLLRHISYSSVAVIALGYRSAQIRQPLRSPGFFVPAAAPFELRSASVNSLKYPGRAPADAVLIRASLGGDHHSSIISQSNSELIQLAHDELSQLLDIDAEPTFASVQRQMFAIPQYRLGHHELVDAVRVHLREYPGLALAGNAYGGIGVPYCIASGEQAAQQVHEYNSATPVCCSQQPLAALPAQTQEKTAHA